MCIKMDLMYKIFKSAHYTDIQTAYTQMCDLTHKAPNTTIAEFANTADPDETAHNEPSNQNLQCPLAFDFSTLYNIY